MGFCERFRLEAIVILFVGLMDGPIVAQLHISRSHQPSGLQLDGDIPLAPNPNIRVLSSFSHLHIAVDDDGGTLNREFLREAEGWIRSRQGPPYRLPFGWALADSPTSSAASEVLFARANSDTAKKGGVVVEFADRAGVPVAIIRESSSYIASAARPPLRRVLQTLEALSRATQTARRLVMSFPMIHVRPDGTENGLRARVIKSLQQRGPWKIIDVMSDLQSTKGDDVLVCELRSTTGNVGLRCATGSELVVNVTGGSCRSCFGEWRFRPSADTIAAADAAVQALVDHRTLVEQIYSPQLIRRE